MDAEDLRALLLLLLHSDGPNPKVGGFGVGTTGTRGSTTSAEKARGDQANDAFARVFVVFDSNLKDFWSEVCVSAFQHLAAEHLAVVHLAFEKLALSIWNLSIWHLSIWHLRSWH